MAKPRVRLNYARLDGVVAHLEHLGVPPDTEDPVPINLSDAVLGSLNLVTVAINHQTTPVHGVALRGEIFGKPRRGWDYLRECWIQALQNNEAIADPENLARFTEKQLDSILLGSPIDGPKRRVELLRDIGVKMLRNGWRHIDDLYESAEGYLVRKD